MGEAKRRALHEAKLIRFDFAGPEIAASEALRRQFTDADGDGFTPRAVKHLIEQLVAAEFPRGMDRKESRIWLVWQDDLDAAAEGQTVAETTVAQVEWLNAIATKEGLRLPFGIVQWREALVAYLADLLAKAKAGPAPA